MTDLLQNITVNIMMNMTWAFIQNVTMNMNDNFVQNVTMNITEKFLNESVSFSVNKTFSPSPTPVLLPTPQILKSPKYPELQEPEPIVTMPMSLPTMTPVETILSPTQSTID